MKPKAICIGCGYGDEVELNRKFGFDAIGIDVDEDKIYMARKKYGGDFYIKNAWDVNYNDYHLIVARGIFEYIFLFEQMIEKIFNEMREGAILEMSIPNVASWRKRLRLLLLGKSPNYSRLPSRVYDVNLLGEILSKFPWARIEIEAHDGKIFARCYKHGIPDCVDTINKSIKGFRTLTKNIN